MRRGGISAVAGAVVLISMAGCGQESAVQNGTQKASATTDQVKAVDPADSPGLRKSDVPWNGEGDPFNAMVKLPDGRRVAMHYLRRKGLFEQHYSPKTGWSKPVAIYRTKTEACQGITLKTGGGTVAAIADFGVYCADGEPPTESIAAVGIGRLNTWVHHLTDDFDGWERVSVTANGRRATFIRNSTETRTSLRWDLGKGFSAITERPR